jgi:hypothetical protein
MELSRAVDLRRPVSPGPEERPPSPGAEKLLRLNLGVRSPRHPGSHRRPSEHSIRFPRVVRTGSKLTG